MRALFLFLFLTAFHAVAQTYYPVNKDGKWGLMDENGGEALAPQYDYIKYQSLGDKFVYDQRGKFGIMHFDGTILSEPLYEAVEYLDTTISGRKLDGKWSLFIDNKSVTENLYDSVNWVAGDIYSLHKKGQMYFFDAAKTEQNPQAYTSWYKRYNYLEATKKSGSFDLIGIDNSEVLVKDYISIKWLNYDVKTIISYADSMQIFNRNDDQFLCDKYESVSYQFGPWYLLKNDTTALMFDSKKDRLIPIRNIDQIVDVSGNLCVYKRNKKLGVYNFKTGKTVMPHKYTGLALKGGSIYISKGSKHGMARANGKIVLEAEYENIDVYDNVYVVKKDGKFGIASKSGKIIEPIQHKKIEVYPKNIKCYKGKQLITMNVDGSGNVNDRTTYDSYMRVNFTKAKRPVQRSSSLNFGSSNNNNLQSFVNNFIDPAKFGWFQKEIERTIKDSTFIVYGSWGCKDQDDSLRLKHQFYHVIVKNDTMTLGFKKKIVENLGAKGTLQRAFSLGYHYQIGDYVGLGDRQFQMVNHEDYYLLTRNMFMNVQFQDWDKYALARAFTKKPVLIDNMGKIVYDDLTYYDYYYADDHLRVCQGGEYEFFKDRKNPGNLFRVSNLLLVNFNLKALVMVDRKGKVNQDFYKKRKDLKPLCRINKGKWHFIDKNGNLKNEEPFQFAYAFQNGRAIVQRNNKWGVVDTAMNVIVPIEFNWVKRMVVDGEIFFKVHKKNKQSFYYNRANSSYSLTDIDPTKLTQHHDGKWLYGEFENQSLIDSNLNDLGKAPYTGVYNGYGEYKLASTGDNYTVMDADGKLTSKTFETKNVYPIAHGRFMMKGSGNNFAVLDKDGSYLVPKYIGSKIIANTPNCIFYLDYNLDFKYWSNQEINVPKKVKVLSGNPEIGILLCQKGKKKFLFNYNTQEVIKKKNVDAVKSLEQSAMVFEDVNNHDRLGLISYDGDTLMKGTYWNIDFNGRGWGIAKIKSDEYQIIDPKGNLMYPDTFSLVTRMSDRKDYFKAITSQGMGVLDMNGKVILDFKYNSIYMYSPEVFKVSEKDIEGFRYIKADGEEVWHVKKVGHHGFPPNGYTTTVRPYQWSNKEISYFYDGYQNLALPFSDIFPLSSNTFIVQEESQEGVYDMQGDTIVPIQYHYVREVRGKFQVRFFNSFGYVNTDKSRMYDPYVVN